jgi:hypothetical protein
MVFVFKKKSSRITAFLRSFTAVSPAFLRRIPKTSSIGFRDWERGNFTAPSALALSPVPPALVQHIAVSLRSIAQTRQAKPLYLLRLDYLLAGTEYPHKRKAPSPRFSWAGSFWLCR